MGYCPYQCVLCGDIQDGEWGNYSNGLADVMEEQGYKIGEHGEEFEDHMGRVLSYDLCTECLRSMIKPASD